MEKKLTDAQALALNAVIAERDRAVARYNEAITEMLRVWAPGISGGRLEGRPGGVYIVEGEEQEVTDE